jgi:hypothetical protein
VATEQRPRAQPSALADDPLWYKDAVIYQLHLRAFHDSDGDGAGDFGGLTAKLDYLQDLGVTALWLLPFYPSPLRDDGYDIADYTNVHPQYGTLRDFQVFLREARRRGLRVITELVLNHTSDEHPWFQQAGTASTATSRTSTSITRKSIRRCSALSISGWPWGLMASAWTPCPTSTNAKAPAARTSPRRTSSSRACAGMSMRSSPLVCCSQRPTSGRKMPPPTSATAMSAI